jgi:hypothetical protein
VYWPENPDMNKVEAFAGQVIADISATFSGVMTNIGHKLGLYKAMAGAGALTSQQLAEATGTHERYVREWLNNQVAGGYINYDAEAHRYTLPDAHVPVLADDESPVFLVPALEVAASLWLDEDRISGVFQRCVSKRRRHRLGRTSSPPVLWQRVTVPARLQGTSDDYLDHVAKRCRGETACRRKSRGCRLWPRRLDYRHGASLPQFGFLWFRQS